MENPVYNLSEALICFAPAFLIIATVGLLLLKNSWPSKDDKKPSERSTDEQVGK